MKKQPAARPNAKARKAQAEKRRDDARALEFCNVLAFWRQCHIRACRRNQCCCGDVQACFSRHWRSVPDHHMVFIRARINASEMGFAPAAAVHAAFAARDRYLQSHPVRRRRNSPSLSRLRARVPSERSERGG